MGLYREQRYLVSKGKSNAAMKKVNQKQLKAWVQECIINDNKEIKQNFFLAKEVIVV